MDDMNRLSSSDEHGAGRKGYTEDLHVSRTRLPLFAEAIRDRIILWTVVSDDFLRVWPYIRACVSEEKAYKVWCKEAGWCHLLRSKQIRIKRYYI